MVWSIAAARSTDWGLAGVPGGIPTVDVDSEVRYYCAKGTGTTDDSDAFQKAVDNSRATAASPKAILIPKGTYNITRPIRMRSGVVFRGEGNANTIVKFNLGKAVDGKCFIAQGSTPGGWNNIASGYTHGSKTLVLKSTTNLSVGSIIEIQQTNNAAAMYTSQVWNVTWARDAVGEINRIANINGLTVTLDNAIIHTGYGASFAPKLRAISPIVSCGFEDFYLTRLDEGGASSNYGAFFYFDTAWKSWIKRVETFKANYIHNVWVRAFQCEARTNYMHHSWGAYPTSQGYHFDIRAHSTLNLFEDNVLMFGKGYWPAVGACGNVWGFNFVDQVTDAKNWNYDCECHGHWNEFSLIEGSVIKFPTIASYWGPSPTNTLFRNRVVTYIAVYDKSHNCTIVANELNSAAGAVSVASGVTGTLVHANEIKGVRSDLVGQDTVLPASLYKVAKPAWWDNSCPWPCFGPDVTNGVNPAMRRAQSGKPIPDAAYIPPDAPDAPVGDQYTPISLTSKVFVVSFKATPLADDADVCMSLGSTKAPAQDSPFKLMATTVRFNASGKIDARNGAVYTTTPVIAYVKDTEYTFRFVVDLTSSKYDCFVNDAVIGIQLDFRVEQNKLDAIDQFMVVTVAGGATIASLAVMD